MLFFLYTFETVGSTKTGAILRPSTAPRLHLHSPAICCSLSLLMWKKQTLTKWQTFSHSSVSSTYHSNSFKCFFFCINFMHSNVLCCFPAVLLPPLGKVEEETLWIHFSKKFICVIVFYSHKKNCFAILWKVRDAMVVPRCSSFTCRNCYCITLI